MANKKEDYIPKQKMSALRKSSLRRKSSRMEEVKKNGVPGSLFKPKDSKPYKKTLSAAEIRAKENAEALRKLSMSLWRRINAGYIIFRNPKNSLYSDSYKWLPDLMEPTNRLFMHMRDAFSEFIEVLARENLAWPKPPRPKLVFVPAKDKARLKAQQVAARAAQKLKAMIKMGMVSQDSKGTLDSLMEKKKGAK